VRRTTRKVPLTTAGCAASSTNRTTWTTYSAASRSSVGVGLGFVLDGDGIVCVDLDNCVANGHVAEWAQRILDRMPGTFVEFSQSGKGMHVFGFADGVRGRVVKVPGGKIEVYGWGRYVAVTGNRLAGTPCKLADISEAVASFL
jgi:primase-polymerase (primpol)-like protein